jgi:YegS/Rv2252/BmrU family lipid kinase
MKHIFIINPIAGNGKYQIELESSIHRYFNNDKGRYDVYITKGKGDSQHYIEEKCKENKAYTFYSCGGDGTLHEIINVAYKYKHVNVALIPCGSGNDFVKNFTNNNNFYDIASLVNGTAIYVDLVKVNDRYSTSVCNIGFDADVAYNMDKFRKIPFISGPTRYLLSVVYCLVKKLGNYLEIKFDDGTVIQDDFLLSVAANGMFYGGGYKCAPYASINDNLIDVVLINKVSRFKIMNLINKYKRGEHLIDEGVKKVCTYKKCEELLIKSKSSINVCIDGENYSYDQVKLKIEKAAINFVIPKGSQICEQAVFDGELNFA